jgi:hypothetical protein
MTEAGLTFAVACRATTNEGRQDAQEEIVKVVAERVFDGSNAHERATGVNKQVHSIDSGIRLSSFESTTAGARKGIR